MDSQIRFGFWLPIFGGWLRNVEDERMAATWEYNRRLARRAEEIGFDLTLIAELNLNDIKGPSAGTMECWTTAAALAAVTDKLELMSAIRPGFRLPAITAKMAANVDCISGGRFTLNVVSAWWQQEMREYGGTWVEHDKRYERTREFIEILRGLWTEEEFSYMGEHYNIEKSHLVPKPLQHPYPRLYAGGESEAAKEMIAGLCDAYLMHGDPANVVSAKVDDMARRRQRLGKNPLQYGIAGYAIVRRDERETKRELERITNLTAGSPGFFGFEDFVRNSHLERSLALQEYSVSNRGLRTGLLGTPERVAEQFLEFKRAGVTIFLLQFSPQYEEMERFAEEVIPLVRQLERAQAASKIA